MLPFIYWILGTFFVALVVLLFTKIILAMKERAKKPHLPLER